MAIFIFQTVWIGVPQAGHTEESLFYVWVHRSWLGMAQKWSILDQKWLNMVGLSVLQSGPKGFKRTKMVNLSVFDHLEPFSAHLDPFWPTLHIRPKTSDFKSVPRVVKMVLNTQCYQFTLISKKKSVFAVSKKKQAWSQFSKYRFQKESALGHKLWQAADSFWNWYFENCGRACFLDTSYFC